jgi:ribosomal protein S18 acetylase RimI-like enzyme
MRSCSGRRPEIAAARRANSICTLSASPSEDHSITVVSAADLHDLLGLMRAYCDFYRATPSDAALLALSRALLADREREGLQLIARDESSTAVGFATIFWTWTTTGAGRIGTMNDLYVAPAARGQGLADRLIGACLEHCRERGAGALEWQTAPENLRAQAVYDRVGATRSTWVDYSLAVPGA